MIREIEKKTLNNVKIIGTTGYTDDKDVKNFI